MKADVKQVSFFEDLKKRSNKSSSHSSSYLPVDLVETTDQTKPVNNGTTTIEQITIQSPNQTIQSDLQSATTIIGKSKDDVKMNVVLNWPYLKLHKQASQWLTEKQYKKVWEVLTIYYEKRKRGMSVTDRVLINRRFLCCACKILKEAILDTEQESEEKIASFLDRATRALFESYRYLNLYITHILKIQENKIDNYSYNQVLLNDVSFLTSDDEYFVEMSPRPEKTKTIKEMNTLYILNNFRDLKVKYLKGHEYISVQKIEYMISLKNIELNLHLELDQFFINIISIFMWSAFMYKKFHKMKNAFWFLKEAERIGDTVSLSNNEDLLSVVGKIQVALSNIYYECNQNYQAREKVEKAIMIIQSELRLRQVKLDFHKSIEADEAMIKCAKVLVISMVNLALYQEENEMFQEALFTIQTAEWVCYKYIKSLDETRKYCIKASKDLQERYSEYFQTNGELEQIVKRVFEEDLRTIDKIWEETKRKKSTPISDYVNKEIYNDMKIGELNRMKFIKLKDKPKISVKELERAQAEDRRKKKEQFAKYHEEMMELKNQVKDENGTKSSNEELRISSISNDDIRNYAHLKTEEKNGIAPSEQKVEPPLPNISLNQIRSQRSEQPNEIRVSENDEKDKKMDKSGNTQIDLEDSASSDDFFGDVFEGFMSEDDQDNSGKSKNEDDSDDSIAKADYLLKQVQKKKLIKQKKEFGPNYIPKVLTTNMFLQPLDNLKIDREHLYRQAKIKDRNKEAKKELNKQKYTSTISKKPEDFKKELEFNFFHPIEEALQEGKSKKETVQQFLRPQSALEYEFQGMDIHIESKLREVLTKDGKESKPFQWVKEDSENVKNIEQKYKREIRYSQRILNIKRRSELKNNCKTINYSKFPNKITFEKQINDEGYLIQARKGFEEDIEEKKTKQEEIIQGEIKLMGKKDLRKIILDNRESSLFKDANNLKHVYYDYMQMKKEQDKLKIQQNDRFNRENTYFYGHNSTSNTQSANNLLGVGTHTIDNIEESREMSRKPHLDQHDKSPISLKNNQPPSFTHIPYITKSPSGYQDTETISKQIQYSIIQILKKSLGGHHHSLDNSTHPQQNNKQPDNIHNDSQQNVGVQQQNQTIQNNNLTQTMTSISSEKAIKNIGQSITASPMPAQNIKNSRLKWITRTSDALEAKNNISKLTSAKKQLKNLFSNSQSVSTKKNNKMFEDSYDMMKLAGSKSNVQSKAQQIQFRWEKDQKEMELLDPYSQSAFKEKLLSNVQKSNKSLKIVVEEVTGNLQKDKQQLQQTKFKLGVAKNITIDDHFGQRLVSHEDQILAKSIQGISKSVNREFMSFTEVVRLAKLKRKMELSSIRGVLG